MGRQKRSLVFVPPKHERIHYLRIRMVFILFIMFVLVGGVTGFFIPFDVSSIDSVELNKKRNLIDQNKKLLVKIQRIREILFAMHREVTGITDKKSVIERTIGFNSSDFDSDRVVKIKDFQNIGQINTYINSLDSFYLVFFQLLKNKPEQVFSTIPVIQPFSSSARFVRLNRFGKIDDPFTNTLKWHYGIDYATDAGTPVISPASGVVTMVQEHSQWGKRVRVNHDHNFSTVYAHLGTVTVRQGQTIKKGSRIGTVGSTGIATGPHLHYELLYKERQVNPEEFIFPESLSYAGIFAIDTIGSHAE